MVQYEMRLKDKISNAMNESDWIRILKRSVPQDIFGLGKSEYGWIIGDLRD